MNEETLAHRGLLRQKQINSPQNVSVAVAAILQGEIVTRKQKNVVVSCVIIFLLLWSGDTTNHIVLFYSCTGVLISP
jgi:hypothetical protein